MKKVGAAVVALILIALLGFAVWYVANREKPTPIVATKPEGSKPSDLGIATAPDRPIAKTKEEPPPQETDVLQPGFSERKSGNLLRLKIARREAVNASPSDVAGLAALTDDDPATVAVAVAAPTAPLEVVYGFGGATVTVEQLLILLPKTALPDAATGRVEILISNLSPRAGFQLVRTDPLALTGQLQHFALPQTGGKWVMLRFFPTAKANRVAVAEVGVLGHVGPPVSQYAFKEAPAKAFDLLARLKQLTGLDVTISPDEAALFADVKDGKLHKWSFADAALLASGITDAAKRKAYLAQIDELFSSAKKEVPEAAPPWEKGDKLLQWLHGSALAKGYVSGQTDLSVILDSKTFNCVSSAVLFDIIAQRLGLDARGIEVPGHAYAIVYNGTNHADAETTTPRGFNPARDPAIGAEFTRQTGFVYIPDSHRDKRREVNEVGMVALIYYNHAVDLSLQKRYHEAIVGYFKALSLDPELAMAVKNTLTVMAFWSADLADRAEFEQALTLLGTGLSLAPKDATLLHNRLAVWTNYAAATAATGKEDEALAIMKRAYTEVRSDHFLAMQAWLFIRKAEPLAQEAKWDEAIAAVEPGFAKVDKGATGELQHYRAGLRLRKAHAALAAKHFEEAIAILVGGMAKEPDDKRFPAHLAFAIQEWTSHVQATEGDAKARTLLAEQLQRFKNIPAVQGVAVGYVWRVVKGLLDSEKYQEALAFIERSGDLISDKDTAQSLIVAVYDAWATRLEKQNKFKEAIAVCDKALEKHPKDKQLGRRRLTAWDAWADYQASKKEWDEALAVWKEARKQLGNDPEVDEYLLLVALRWHRRIYEQSGRAEADRILTELSKEFPTLSVLASGVGRDALVRLMRQLGKAGNYDQAAAILAGLAEPGGAREDQQKVFLALLRELVQPGADRRLGKSEVVLSAPGLREALLKRFPDLLEQLTLALGDPDAYVRRDAADCLSHLGGPAVAEALARRIADDQWVPIPEGSSHYSDEPWDGYAGLGSKDHALAALRHSAPDKVADALLAASKATEPKVRAWALVELGKLGGNAAAAALIANLSDASASVRLKAAENLAGHKDPAAVTALCQALTDKDGQVRRAAADSLAKIGDKAAVPSLVRRVTDSTWVATPSGFFTYHDTDIYDGLKGIGSKDHALAALRQLAPDRATAALAEAMKVSIQPMRIWATVELGNQKDAVAIAALMPALQDKDPVLRRTAADSLAKLGDKSAVAALQKRVADDLWNALPREQSSVHEASESFDDFRESGSKHHALAALRKVAAADEVTRALLDALKSANEHVRAWAALELGKQKGADVLPALIKALDDASGYVRRGAADGLLQVGDKGEPVVAAVAKRIGDDKWVAPPKGSFSYRDEPYDGFRDLGSKDHALAALKKLAPDKVKDALEAATKSANADVKAWAEKELKNLK